MFLTDTSAVRSNYVSGNLQQLPNLGFGEPFRADLFLHRNKIDFLEITADHFFDANPKKIEELNLLNDHFPLISHGLNLSL